MGIGAAITANSLPPLPPGAQLQGASTPQNGLPPLPSGAKLTSAPPAAKPPVQTAPAKLTDNPSGEGVYQMAPKGGQPQAIPFSQVEKAAMQGYLFVDKPTLAQYARDHAAQPINEDTLDRTIDQMPWYHPMRMARDVLSGIGGAADKTLTAFDRTPTTRGEQDLQLAAQTPSKGMENVGELGENIGEFFTGQELMGLLGRTGQAMGVAEKLKAATGLAQVLEKNTLLAKVLKLGMAQAKTATIAGGQTYVKTGGNAGAAAEAAGATAVLGAGMAGAARIPLTRAEAAVPGAAEYAGEARAAVRPQLERAGEAMERPPAEPAQTTALAKTNMLARPGGATAKAAPFNVDAVLNQVHDFTGAADRALAVADPMYAAIDKATGGAYRPLNAEVAAAQKAAWKGAPGAQAEYEKKLAEMNTLIDSTKGTVTPEILQSAKALFRQSYILRDMGNAWDSSLGRVPGNVSAGENLGVNGKRLMSGLQRAVKSYTRPALEEALGPGRLENLETIARMNQTVPQQRVFYNGVRAVVRDMFHGAIIGGLAGEIAGGERIAGATVGAAAMGAKPGAEFVLRAIQSNPRIGQFFTSAIEMGARPAVYAPMISRMIQEQTEGATEEKNETAPQP
jgi:hypothetical protein